RHRGALAVGRRGRGRRAPLRPARPRFRTSGRRPPPLEDPRGAGRTMTRDALDVLVVTAAGQRVGVPAEQIRRLRRTEETLPGLLSNREAAPAGASPAA